VPEHEQPIVLGKKLGDDQLVDRSKPHRWRNVEHHRQLVEREPPSEDGGDERAASCQVRHPVETIAHGVPDPCREARLAKSRPVAVDPNEALLPPSVEQLDEQEGAAVRPLHHLRQIGVGCGAQDVGHHLRDGLVSQRCERHPVRPGVLEALDHRSQLRRRLGGAMGDEPHDRKAGKAHGERPQCGEAGPVRPLHIVEAEQQRGAQRRLLEQRLELVEQQVALLGEVVERRPGRRIHHRRPPLEEGAEERTHRHGLVPRRDHPGPDGQADTSGDRRGLGEQPGLPQTGASLDDDSRPPALQRALDPPADHGELPVSSSHRGSSHACLRPRWRSEVHSRGRASIAQRGPGARRKRSHDRAMVADRAGAQSPTCPLLRGTDRFTDRRRPLR
jgi:hypothetical protein